MSGNDFLFNLILQIILDISVSSQNFIFRLQVIRVLRYQLKTGKIDSEFFASDKEADRSGRGETPEEYLKRMAQPGIFQDTLFLHAMAFLLGHDIVILPLHGEDIIRIFGGGDRIGSGVPCQTCPLFIGKIYINSSLTIFLLRLLRGRPLRCRTLPECGALQEV